ncbi:MAG: 4Fe-4S dicluster domain-containing protein [Gemmataceae bacterium]
MPLACSSAHFLEEWSDGIAHDGTASICQPLIAPLYISRSLHEVLGAVTPAGSEGSYEDRSPMELVQAYWRANRPAATAKQAFDDFWATALHDGVVAGTRRPTVTPALVKGLFGRPEMQPPAASSDKGYELTFAPDPGVYDGRFANNGWLQEWPRPITRLSWDNAALMSPATAEKVGVKPAIGTWKGGEHGETITSVVELKVGTKTLKVPAWVVPGHADDAVTLYLGYGRTHAGHVGKERGANANRIRQARAASFATGVTVTRTNERVSLACQQAHHSMEGRDIVRSGTVKDYAEDKHFPARADHPHSPKEGEGGASGKHSLSLLPETFQYTGYKWGMAIDLGACIGCGACVVACQAENNIPVVGKDQVLRGREMHWLRIDRYFASHRETSSGHSSEDKGGKTGELTGLEVHFQPLPCQHCEYAPCELVCPVEATAHGDEGTNDMVYNRCVGTRYCQNNCPYKVRRFNFLQYGDYETSSLRGLYNPDVTVRTRGVMEKCTFCIQRIAYARIEASKEALDEMALPPKQRKRVDPYGRTDHGQAIAYIRDGEVVSACQASCPTEAIVFGDLNDEASKVRKLHDASLKYYLLDAMLNTRPRVAYLASVTNPNPELEAK